MTSYTIGFKRDDGSFQVLATLNDNDGLIKKHMFQRMAEALCADFETKIRDKNILLLNRQDAPDHINLEE